MRLLRDLGACFQRDSESRGLGKKSESARCTSMATSWLRERKPELFGSGSRVTQSVRFGRRNRGEPNRIPITVWLEMALRWSGPLEAEQESDLFVSD